MLCIFAIKFFLCWNLKGTQETLDETRSELQSLSFKYKRLSIADAHYLQAL